MREFLDHSITGDECAPFLECVNDSIADLDRQDIFLSFTADSKYDIIRHLPNDSIVPDGVVNRVDVEDWIDVVERPVLPVLDLGGQNLIRHVRYESLRGFKTIDIYERVGDLAGGHPLGIHGDIIFWSMSEMSFYRFLTTLVSNVDLRFCRTSIRMEP